MQRFVKLLQDLKSQEFKISNTARGEQIQQTQRNNLKKSLLQTMKLDLQDILDYVYESEEGILIEVANDSIADGITNDTGSGAITLAVDIKVLGLEHNAEDEGNAFEQLQSEKLAEKQAKEKDKQAKIARDKANRQAKADAKANKG